MTVLRQLLRAAVIPLGVVALLAAWGAVSESASANRDIARVPLAGALMDLTSDGPAGMLPPWRAADLRPVDIDTFDTFWRALQPHAQRATRGRWRVGPNTGHLISQGQPHAVAEAVLDMLAETRQFAANTSPPH